MLYGKPLSDQNITLYCDDVAGRIYTTTLLGSSDLSGFVANDILNMQIVITKPLGLAIKVVNLEYLSDM